MAGFKINLKSLIIRRANKTGEIVNQAQIGRATGISQPTLSRWENGITVDRLDFKTVYKLTQFFDCELCDLVSLEGENEDASGSS